MILYLRIQYITNTASMNIVDFIASQSKIFSKNTENNKKIITDLHFVFFHFASLMHDMSDTSSLNLNFEEYKIIYHIIKEYEFNQSFLTELENTHYKGNRNINRLSGFGWDIYLPESMLEYEITTIPENLDKVVTDYKLVYFVQTRIELNRAYANTDVLTHVVVLNFKLNTLPDNFLQKMPHLQQISLSKRYSGPIDFSHMPKLKIILIENNPRITTRRNTKEN
jgi:hypothetical protein